MTRDMLRGTSEPDRTGRLLCHLRGRVFGRHM